jgi:DNA (cytosine-5)-methyltransferase 1
VIATRQDLMLFDAPVALAGEAVELCAGPGGVDMGARILGLPESVGVDIDPDACATARAAGFRRVPHETADIRTLHPELHYGVKGVISTTPCPSLSRAGSSKTNAVGRGQVDYQQALDVITGLGWGCDLDQAGWVDLPERVADIRTALLVETARWALHAPDLEWLVAENVPGAEFLFEDIVAELSETWAYTDVVTLDALDFGLGARRVRTFLIARRWRAPRVTIPADGNYGMPRRSMAEALGWPAGKRVWTRGARKTSGGNAFSADGPSWCLTGSTRSWKIGALDGPELTAAEAGLLNGFPLDYPWVGSRTKQFLQVADVVCPPMAAAVLGVATDTEWVELVREYLEHIHARDGRAEAAA